MSSISRIKAVYHALGELHSQVVFLGGATVGFYSDRRAFFEPRPTDDVDGIIEVTYAAHVEFEERLRQKGFVDDQESGVRCRYKLKNPLEEIIVDIMPTADVAMGFTNKWYPPGYQNSTTYVIDDQTTIKILRPEYFLATKFEAFKHRGQTDPRQSQDFEDIVFVLENRRAIWDEIENASADLRTYFKSEFKNLLDNPNIEECIDCHVSFGSPPPTNLILQALQDYADQPTL